MQRNAILARPEFDRRAILVLCALLCAALVAPFVASPARAATVTTTISSIHEFAEKATKLSGDEAADFAELATLPSASESGLTVQSDEPHAWRLDDGSVYVSYQLIGEGVYASNLGAFVAPDGTVAQRTELAIQGDDTSGTVRMWVDGEKTLDRVVTNPDSGLITPQFSWSKFNRCLSSAGIPGYVITALTIACAAVCVGTVGVGCVACIAAAAGIFGGTVGYCLDEA